MQRSILFGFLAIALILGPPRAAQGQILATQDPVLEAIWDQAMNQSQIETLAQTLMDSIGPRLTGAPGIDRGHDWLVERYRDWGIEAENRQYGTWIGWERGISHIDLLEPRVRSLEGMNLAWSAGTDGPVTGEVLVLPDVASPQAFEAWLPEVEGRFVLISPAQPTCRPDGNWEEFATSESLQRMREGRQAWLQGLAGANPEHRTHLSAASPPP
jgi:carboxypeptidase Q